MKKKLIAAVLALSICGAAAVSAVPVFAANANTGALSRIRGEDEPSKPSERTPDPVPIPFPDPDPDIPDDESPVVRVIIKNDTFSEEDGAAWDGVLCDESAVIDDNSTILTVLKNVIEKHGFTQTGIDYGFITEINGLSAEDGGAMGCYLLTLNGWMTDEGADAYSVESGKLREGDEIALVYSTSYGSDIGYDYSGTDTSLENVSFSKGTLTKAFSPDKYDYVLELPKGTDSIRISFKQTNIAYRAKIYHSDTEYRQSENIGVEFGNIIMIICGDPSWSAYPNENAKPSIYTFLVSYQGNNIINNDNGLQYLIAMAESYSPAFPELVRAARARYDSLTPEQAAQISNYDSLLKAEEALSAPGPAPVGDHYDVNNQLNTEQLLGSYLSYISENVPVIEGAGEWTILSLARMSALANDKAEAYKASLKAALDEKGSAKLSDTRSTTNSLVVMTLTSIGVDPRSFYGYDLLSPLADLDYVKQQGLNGPVYALLALDSHAYDVPAAAEGVTQTTREALIKAILDEQQQDGGWTIDTWTENKSGSDADMTAMVLQALAPYRNKDEAVGNAIEKALAFLKENQDSNGMFVSYGSADCESCAQVVTALCALGIDADADDLFVNSTNSPFTALRIFYIDGQKMFCHTPRGEANGLATDQGYQGVIAMWRYENAKNGMTSFFDMTDVSIVPLSDTETPSTESKPESTPLPVPNDNVNTGDSSFAAVAFVIAALSSAVLAVSLRKKEKI